jgi:transposase
MGIEPALFTKDAFLSSLDFICRYDSGTKRIDDYTVTIEDTLYQQWRKENPLPPGEKETVAYDMTTVLFFGVTCPLALLGYNPKHIKRLQANLALIVSRFDKYPISHFVYPGNRNAASTVKNMIVRLDDMAIEKGTIIWDRGNVSKAHVKSVEAAQWKLICGVPKTSKDAKNLIKNTLVPINPTTFVHKSKSNHIYAVQTKGQLFDKERTVTVYINQERRSQKINDLNLALSELGERLDELSVEGKEWAEGKLRKAIKETVEKWERYFHIRVKRTSLGPRITWRLKKREISASDSSYGKYLIHSTDESLSPKEVIKAYFEKDFIEKVFRVFKIDERMEPVRHRKEARVRGYLFVCVLAYRLLAALRLKFEQAEIHDNSWERTHSLLRELGRVERAEVGYGDEVRSWYLNITKDIEDSLKLIGMEGVVKDGSC